MLICKPLVVHAAGGVGRQDLVIVVHDVEVLRRALDVRCHRLNPVPITLGMKDHRVQPVVQPRCGDDTARKLSHLSAQRADRRGRHRYELAAVDLCEHFVVIGSHRVGHEVEREGLPVDRNHHLQWHAGRVIDVEGEDRAVDESQGRFGLIRNVRPRRELREGRRTSGGAPGRGGPKGGDEHQAACCD